MRVGAVQQGQQGCPAIIERAWAEIEAVEIEEVEGVEEGLGSNPLPERALQANFWAVKAKSPRSGLYYVLALVPDCKPDRFFVLTQERGG